MEYSITCMKSSKLLSREFSSTYPEVGRDLLSRTYQSTVLEDWWFNQIEGYKNFRE